jgi:hypothetical protein
MCWLRPAVGAGEIFKSAIFSISLLNPGFLISDPRFHDSGELELKRPFNDGPGSAGVSPAKLSESMPLSFSINAGEAPAFPGRRLFDSYGSLDPWDTKKLCLGFGIYVLFI